MALKKYLKDYRVKRYTDENGRRKTEIVYIGSDYILSPPVRPEEKRKVFIMSVILWLFFLGAILPVARSSHLAYVILPFAFSMIPMFLLTGAAFSFYRAKEILRRPEAERISFRLPVGALITAILMGISVLGLIAGALVFRERMLFGDLIFGALSLLTALSAGVIFRKCRGLKALRVDDAAEKDRD